MFFRYFWVSPFAALFFVVPLFFLCEKRVIFTVDLFLFFLPSFHKAYTFFTVSCLTTNLVAWFLFDQVLFFFCLLSEPGRSEPGALLLFYLVSEPGWFGPGNFVFFCAWCLSQLQMTSFIHLEQLRVGKMFTFFCFVWARSGWARWSV